MPATAHVAAASPASSLLAKLRAVNPETLLDAIVDAMLDALAGQAAGPDARIRLALRQEAEANERLCDLITDKALEILDDLQGAGKPPTSNQNRWQRFWSTWPHKINHDKALAAFNRLPWSQPGFEAKFWTSFEAWLDCQLYADGYFHNPENWLVDKWKDNPIPAARPSEWQLARRREKATRLKAERHQRDRQSASQTEQESVAPIDLHYKIAAEAQSKGLPVPAPTAAYIREFEAREKRDRKVEQGKPLTKAEILTARREAHRRLSNVDPIAAEALQQIMQTSRSEE